MSWALIAIFGYFFHAVSSLLDKYLLSDRHIPAPATYAFFVSIFSLFVLVFTPFGFTVPDFPIALVYILSGFAYLYGLVALYTAVRTSEVSRVSPLAGTVMALTAFLAPFLPGVFGEPVVNIQFILALVLLIIGGFLISFDLPVKRGERVPFFVILAGIGIGTHYLLLKYGYTETNFVTGLVWSRIGMFTAGMTLLLFPALRREIFSKSTEMKAQPKRSLWTAAVFLINKSSAGAGSILIAYATFLGSTAFVQALNGIQYVFLLMLALPFAIRYPDIFQEKLGFWDWFQKGVAVVIIGVGLFLASVGGVALL